MVAYLYWQNVNALEVLYAFCKLDNVVVFFGGLIRIHKQDTLPLALGIDLGNDLSLSR